MGNPLARTRLARPHRHASVAAAWQQLLSRRNRSLTDRITPDRFAWISDRLHEADRLQMRRRLIPRRHEGPYVIEEGRRMINFGSNDYLGIAMQSTPLDASRGAAGAGSSPLVCGFTPLHARLCDQLAAFEGSESAVLFPSGFAACSGTVAALAEAGDLVLSDALNHASLIDGCRLSKAERFIYPHRDHRAVATLLETHRKRFARVFIVTDAIFSMDGTRAPLVELADIADAFGAVLIVDEAHATGVLGDHGAGLCEELGLETRIPVRVGTLSKALGAHGGFVVGPQRVTDYLLQKARPLIYSTAAPPMVIGAAIEGLRIVHDEPQRRIHVLHLAAELVRRLRQMGFRSTDHGTPIVPLVLGDSRQTLAAAQELAKAGFYVPAIRPPTVPPNTSRLRISLSAAHSDEMIDALCRAISAILPPPKAV